jgi:hypothetical protein
MDHPTRNSHHRAVGRYIAQQHRAGADAGVGTHGDRPQHLGAGAHHHVFQQGGVALAVGLTGAAQGDALIQQAAVADHGRFTDHYSHAVVDEHTMADPSAGVDFNAGSQTPQLTQQPCQ